MELGLENTGALPGWSLNAYILRDVIFKLTSTPVCTPVCVPFSDPLPTPLSICFQAWDVRAPVHLRNDAVVEEVLLQL